MTIQNPFRGLSYSQTFKPGHMESVIGNTGELALVDPSATLRRLNVLGREVQGEIRDEVAPISRMAAERLRDYAESPMNPPQAYLVAKSIIPKRDRLPRVVIGGSKQVGRKYNAEKTYKKGAKAGQTYRGKLGAPAGALLWGSEYGGISGVDRAGRAYKNRFVRPRKPTGYWLSDGAWDAGREARDRWNIVIARFCERISD